MYNKYETGIIFSIDFNRLFYSSFLKYIQSKKVKSKAVPLHAVVALGGRRGIAPTNS
jgi:hypothetical protein